MTKTQKAPPTEHRLLLTIIEAAALLGVGRTTLYELLARGELQAVRSGRSRRVPRQAIDDYVARLVGRDSTQIDSCGRAPQLLASGHASFAKGVG